MAIEERSAAWRMGQSWYVLLTLPFGLLSWLAFFYLGWRARRVKWFVWGVFYLAAVIRIFSFPMETGADGKEEMTAAAGGAILALWIITLVHALVARREFLKILDARDGGAPAYQEAHADPYATLRAPAEPVSPQADFAVFAQPQQPAAPPPAPWAAPAAGPPPVPSAPPPPPGPSAPPPAPRAAEPPPPPFSGPAPFGGSRPFEDENDRPQPPAPPPPPRRPGRQVDY